MRESESGFTLIEMVVVVSIIAIVLIGGAAWMLSMHPGSLRHAVDEYDSALADARALAANSGNGATMVFAPATGSGFTIRVYSGRPTAANAVKATNTFEVVSTASVREATFGAPPFALFFSSAGYATGKAGYPSFDANGDATFATIAQQPACPANGIVLTFTSVQGATDTRKLQCSNVSVTGVNVANPSPTPGAVHISTPSMVAHWTTDTNGALKFVVGEFGYKHWYAKGTTSCDSLVTFKGPNPHNSPTDPNEANLAPAAPANTPISYPSTTFDPDEPRAPFELLPISGSPGECTMTIVDDTGQSVQTNVQVMGDLTPSTTSLTFSSPKAAAQTVMFSKIWDSEALLLSAGGACGGVVTPSVANGSTPASPGTTPATASVTVSPVGAGHCTLIVGDQYGEPHVNIDINVKNQPFATWPESLTLGVSNSPIAFNRKGPTWDYVAFVNAMLGGTTADAATASGCFAQATLSDGKTADPISTLPAFVQTWATQNSVFTDATGCFTGDSALTTPVAANNGNVGVIAYEPSESNATFSIYGQGSYNTCDGTNAIESGWLPLGAEGSVVLLRLTAGTSGGSCMAAVTDQNSSSPSVDHGLVNVTVLTDPCKVSGNVCMAIGQVWNSEDVSGSSGGPPDQCGSCTDTIKASSLWQIYVSSDGGQTWTTLGETLTTTKEVAVWFLGRTLSDTTYYEQSDSGSTCTTNATYKVYNHAKLNVQQTASGDCVGSIELSESSYKYDAWENDAYLVAPRSGTNWQTPQPQGLSGVAVPTAAQYYEPTPLR